MLANIIHCHSYGALDDVCLLFVKCKKGVPLENFTENNKPSYMDWHITRYFANLLHFTFVFANFLHNIPLNCLYCRSAQIPVFFFLRHHFAMKVFAKKKEATVSDSSVFFFCTSKKCAMRQGEQTLFYCGFFWLLLRNLHSTSITVSFKFRSLNIVEPMNHP